MSYDEDNRCLAHLREPSSYFDASRPPSRLMSIKTTSGLLVLARLEASSSFVATSQSRNLVRACLLPGKYRTRFIFDNQSPASRRWRELSQIHPAFPCHCYARICHLLPSLV